MGHVFKARVKSQRKICNVSQSKGFFVCILFCYGKSGIREDRKELVGRKGYIEQNRVEEIKVCVYF